MSTEQARFRYDHKVYCVARAIERCDYDQANIFAAQAAYYSRLVLGVPETPQNRNQILCLECSATGLLPKHGPMLSLADNECPHCDGFGYRH